MASKISYHARSISFPFTCQPVDATTEAHLSRLRIASQCEASSSSSSSSSICRSLADVKGLYERINELIVRHQNQQVLSHDQAHRSGVEAVLEGSVALLDVCGATIDVVSMMKDSVLELESSLRRRSGEALCLSDYKMSRRKVIKSVSKCLGNMKKFDLTTQLEMDDQRLVYVVRILKEAETVCLSTLQSILSFLAGSKARQRWPFVAKLTLHPKQHSADSRVEANEVERIDQALSAFDAKKLTTDAKKVQSLRRQLGELEMSINGIEEGLESVSRCLVKTRVNLLNVLNH